jgi:4-hydroxy-tetrahydrodipicolinate synthase
MLEHLQQIGCHGAVVFGTTGEASSFSTSQRLGFVHDLLRYREQKQPEMKMMIGTGCSNLEDTVCLTRSAFDWGADAVLTLPPFYFKSLNDQGLYQYYAEVIHHAVPAKGKVFLYHFPQMSGISLSHDLIRALSDRFPTQIAGLKDSSDDLKHTTELCQAFPQLEIFAGSDSILTEVLQHGGAGCITALANVYAPLLRRVWDARYSSSGDPEAQRALNQARVLAKGLPGPSLLKFALHHIYRLPYWHPMLPLLPLSEQLQQSLGPQLLQLLK